MRIFTPPPPSHFPVRPQALADKETLFEVHPQRRVLLIRTAGLTSIEHKIQTLQVKRPPVFFFIAISLKDFPLKIGTKL